jgi:hypothetical protein
LILWGAHDPIIPVSHAEAAAELMPGSRLVIFDQVGHYPHCENPARFVDVLRDFVASSESAHLSTARLRELLRSGHTAPVHIAPAQERRSAAGG